MIGWCHAARPYKPWATWGHGLGWGPVPCEQVHSCVPTPRQLLKESLDANAREYATLPAWARIDRHLLDPEGTT